MKRKIAATFLLCAIEQCISNFDLNISDETQREVLAFETSHGHRIELECHEGCPTDADDSQEQNEEDVAEDEK